MRFTYFTVQSIGAATGGDDFYRCDALLGMADDNKNPSHEIRFSIAYTGPTDDSVDTVRSKILAECVRLMKEGASLLDGKTIQSLGELSEAETARILKSISAS